MTGLTFIEPPASVDSFRGGPFLLVFVFCLVFAGTHP